MSKINIAIDAGGSKVNTVLYDDDFNLISAHRTGSLRDNTTDPALVQANLKAILDDMQLEGKEIGLISGISERILLQAIQNICPSAHFRFLGEHGVGFAAAEIFGDGLLALSGTGATVFGRVDHEHYGIGGYGAAIYDGGSGYWIGRAAFNAAFADDEGRGPHTVLTDMLAQKLGGTKDTLGQDIFKIYQDDRISPTAFVASCTPLVSQAAFAGDPAALHILEQAGYLIGAQVIALVRKHNLPTSLPIAVSGSAWRSHPFLFDTFRETVRQAGLGADLRIPTFEPIVGAVIAHHYAQRGKFDQNDHDRFLDIYRRYRFSTDADAITDVAQKDTVAQQKHDIERIRQSLI